MESKRFIQELLQGKQELVNKLAHAEAQIKELKVHRKSLTLQIANSDGAIAGAKELQAREDKATEETDEDESES